MRLPGDARERKQGSAWKQVVGVEVAEEKERLCTMVVGTAGRDGYSSKVVKQVSWVGLIGHLGKERMGKRQREGDERAR